MGDKERVDKAIRALRGLQSSTRDFLKELDNLLNAFQKVRDNIDYISSEDLSRLIDVWYRAVGQFSQSISSYIGNKKLHRKLH